MAPDKREWTVPAPLRGLLWWPFVAFALVLVSPSDATVSIMASGLALLVLGAVYAVVAGRLERNRPVPAAVAPSVEDRPTVEMPTVQMQRPA